MKKIYEYTFAEKDNPNTAFTLLLKQPPMVAWSKHQNTLVYKCSTIDQEVFEISYELGEIIKAKCYSMSDDTYKGIFSKMRKEVN